MGAKNMTGGGVAKAEITGVLDAYVDAVWHKDADAMLELYAPDFRGFDMWGDWVQEQGALRRSVADWFGGLAADEKVKVGLSDVRVTEGGNLAVIEAFVRFAATAPDDSEIRAMDNRFTWVLRKDAGDWRILHHHSSVPLGDGATPASRARAEATSSVAFRRFPRPKRDQGFGKKAGTWTKPIASSWAQAARVACWPTV